MDLQVGQTETYFVLSPDLTAENKSKTGIGSGPHHSSWNFLTLLAPQKIH